MKKAIYLLLISLFPFVAFAKSGFGCEFGWGTLTGFALNEFIQPRQVYVVRQPRPIVYPSVITQEVIRPVNISTNENANKKKKLELRLIQEQNELLRQQNRQRKLALKQEELQLRKQQLQLKAKLSSSL